MDLSIIIPAYNCSDTLPKTLTSILSQEVHGSYEIIIVDDCSNDATLGVAQSFAGQYSQIKVISHEKNQKVSQARASGFKYSCGRYIWNIDSDDELTPGSLQCIMKDIQDGTIDVLIVNAQEVRGTKKGRKLLNHAMRRNLVRCFEGMIWMKIIRRDLIHDDYELFRRSFNMGDDYLYSMELLPEVKRIKVLSRVCYLYHRDIKNSLTRTQTLLGTTLSYKEVLLEACESCLVRCNQNEVVDYYLNDLIVTTLEKKRLLYRRRREQKMVDLCREMVLRTNALLGNIAKGRFSIISEELSLWDYWVSKYRIIGCKRTKELLGTQLISKKEVQWD